MLSRTAVYQLTPPSAAPYTAGAVAGSILETGTLQLAKASTLPGQSLGRRAGASAARAPGQRQGSPSAHPSETAFSVRRPGRKDVLPCPASDSETRAPREVFKERAVKCCEGNTDANKK